MGGVIINAGCTHCGDGMGKHRRVGEPWCINCMPIARAAQEDPMLPFPFSEHRGDRLLAAQLLYEHGRDPSAAEWVNPQVVECLAGMGALADADLFEAERSWRGEAIDGGFTVGGRPVKEV